jgi:Uma2 family endonuclease
MPSVTRLYSVADVRALPDDGNRYETIASELFVTPAPGVPHQTVLARLFAALWAYVERHELGRLWFAPLDLVFGPLTLVEPDLVFVSRNRLSTISDRDVQGPPLPPRAQTGGGSGRSIRKRAFASTGLWTGNCGRSKSGVRG